MASAALPMEVQVMLVELVEANDLPGLAKQHATIGAVSASV